MFRLFTFKQLAITSSLLCFILLFSSLLNTASVYVPVFTKPSVCVPIVMYHQISEKKEAWGDYIVPLSLLREDFQYFKDNNIHPVSFSQLEKYVKNGVLLPENPLVITFDDGEKSFLTKVVPLLEEFSFPANVNIVGALVDLYTENGDNNDAYAYLNKDDIKTLSYNPLVEIGCHTYNLHSLTNRKGMKKLPGETSEQYKNFITEDIRLFKEKYYSLTGKTLTCFAYPFGMRSDELLEILKNEGFTITLTCRESVNTLSVGDNLYELGRFNRHYTSNSKSFFEKILH